MQIGVAVISMRVQVRVRHAWYLCQSSSCLSRDGFSEGSSTLYSCITRCLQFRFILMTYVVLAACLPGNLFEGIGE